MATQADSPTVDPSVVRSARLKVYCNIVLPLFITSVIAYLDRVNLSYVAISMRQDLGFSERVLGFGAGIFFVGYVLFEVPGALIAERNSPKWWIARIMFSWGIVSGMMAFVTNELQFYTLRFLLGAAEASLYPVLYASCIPRWFAAADRARAIALMLTSLQLSSIIGSPLAGMLIDFPQPFGLSGWQSLFLIESIPAILFAFVLVFWMADSPEQAWWLDDRERAFLINQSQAEKLHNVTRQRFTLGQALRDREVIKLCAAYFFWITGFWGFNYWMPTELKEASGWSHVAVGWMIVIPMGLSLICMCWVGHHSSVTGEKRWHGASGMFLAALGLTVGTSVDNGYIGFICLCASAIGVYAAFGVWWSYPTTFLSGAAAAGAIGLINSSGNVGGFIGPYLTAFLKDVTGSSQSGWWFLAACLACAGIIMLTLGRSSPSSGDASIQAS